MNFKKLFLKMALIMSLLIPLCEARGGRRGGAFGGLFGSWRKYKKPLSGGGTSRRIVSSSPVHTPITKAWHENKKLNDHFQKNYEVNNMYNTPTLPVGGSYYKNFAALPRNALYVAQAPPRGSELGDFVTGFLTGRMLTAGFSSPAYHVTHIYKESLSTAENVEKLNRNLEPYNRSEANATKFFNASETVFSTTTETVRITELQNSTTQIPSNATTLFVPPYGIICIPMPFNETNKNWEALQRERIVCYPAPAPTSVAGDITN